MSGKYDYECKVCGYHMRLSPLPYVTVIHKKDGTHTYRITKGPR